MQETNLPEITRPGLEPTPQVAAEQQRLLEMEETIRMLVRRNQDMERQFRNEIETLKQPAENRRTLTPTPPTHPVDPIQQDDQGSSNSIHHRHGAARPLPNDDNQPRPGSDQEPNQAPARRGYGEGGASQRQDTAAPSSPTPGTTLGWMQHWAPKSTHRIGLRHRNEV